MRRAFLREKAEEQLSALSYEEQEEVRRYIWEIIEDPYDDGVCKFSYDRPPLVYHLYVLGGWRITYYIVDDQIIRIGRIDRRSDESSL